MTYLLDANVFITAKNAHYAFDVVPGFWTWLEDAHRAGKVFTVRSAAREVSGGNDQLARWMRAMPDTFRLDVRGNDLPNLAALATWVQSAGYLPYAASEFLSLADYFIVGQAKHDKHVVVTHEVSDPLSRRRVKIPDACIALGVPYMSPYQMLRTEGAKFR